MNQPAICLDAAKVAGRHSRLQGEIELTHSAGGAPLFQERTDGTGEIGLSLLLLDFLRAMYLKAFR